MGWIKLHRKILDSAVYDNSVLLKIWVWCLFKATYKAREQVVGNQIIKLEPGQFIYGRIKCADELGISESMLYRHMMTLKKLGNLNINPNNKYSVVTIVNWSLYQGQDEADEHQSEQQMNSKRTADEQQMNTNKNSRSKEVKNVKTDSASVSEFFETVWALYPNKKGKGAISAAKKEALCKIGIEELTRCIDRYKASKEDWRKWKDGSTFFNSGYVDYLDENYQGTSEQPSAAEGYRRI